MKIDEQKLAGSKKRTLPGVVLDALSWPVPLWLVVVDGTAVEGRGDRVFVLKTRLEPHLSNADFNAVIESHPFPKPLRHAAAMKRKVCDSGTFHAVIVTNLSAGYIRLSFGGKLEVLQQLQATIAGVPFHI